MRTNEEAAAKQTHDHSFVSTRERLDESKLIAFDPVRFDQGMKIWAGSLRTQMLADGYGSVEELMDDLRGWE